MRFRVLYPPKCSHDLPPLAGLYTWKPFQFPGGYSWSHSVDPQFLSLFYVCKICILVLALRGKIQEGPIYLLEL